VHVALNLGDGMVAMFRSRLVTLPPPFFTPERLYRPMIIVAVIVVVVWRFWRKGGRQRALPYDPGFRPENAQRDRNRMHID